MPKRVIDLTRYEVTVSDATIRQIFFQDEDLRLIFIVMNNLEPVTLPEIVKHFNQLFKTTYDKSWFDQKLKKIINFNLYGKRNFRSCKDSENNGMSVESKIIKAHLEWVSTRPKQFHTRFESNEYYYMTDSGYKWIDEVEKIQQKFRKGG